MSCRRCFFLFSLASCFLLTALTGRAAEEEARAQLTVALDDAYPPYTFRSAEGVLQGYLIDLWTAWEKETGIPVRFIGVDWAQAQSKLAEGKADVVDGVFRTQDRESYLDFSRPYADLPTAIYAFREMTGVTDVRALGNFTVGVVHGDACAEVLERQRVHRLHKVSAYPILLEEAIAGKISLFCADETPMDYLLLRNPAGQTFHKAFRLYSEQLHRAVRRGDMATLALVEKGFSAIPAVEYKRLQNKWMGTTIGLPVWWRQVLWGLAVSILVGIVALLWVFTLRRQVAARTRQLEDEQTRLKTLINTLPDPVWLKDPNGVYLLCNRQFELLLDRSEAQIRGRTDQDFFPPDAANAFAAYDRRVIATTGPLVNEEEVVFASGSRPALLETIKTAMRDRRGNLVGVLGIARDITARRATERAAAENQERFMKAFHASPISAAILTVPGGLCVEANESCTRDFGWKREELIGRTSREIGLWSDEKNRDKWLASVQNQGLLVDYETILLDRWGQPRHVNMSSTLIRLNGAPHVLDFVIDITERKRIEAELRDRESYNKVLFAESRIPLVVLDPKSGQFTDCNPAAIALYALADRETLLKQTVYDVSVPLQKDGTPSLLAARRHVLAALEKGSDIFEWRHRRPNGQEWDAEIHLMRFRHNEKVFLQFSVEDITSRKESEENMRLAAKVFESTAEGIVITDASSKIVAVNTAFSEITGYTAADAIGENPRLLRSGKHDPWFYRNLWNTLEETGCWQGEIWNRRKNGEIFPNWETISVVRDDKGNPTHYVAVFSDMTSVKRSQDALDFLAHHDPLTGLPNRVLFQDRLAHALVRGQREIRKLAVLFIDLDRFKHINDTLGHPVGDEILRQAAQAMSDQIRASDTIARIGGDEFVVLLDDDVSVRSTSNVAHKLLDLFRQPFSVHERELYITASIGICLYPNDGEDADSLLKNADLAMYKAKAEGRNNFQFYEPAMGADAFERLIVENALRGAVHRRELLLHYQPQIDLSTGKLAGMEALVRWRHPELGLVAPGRFIPVAEEMGIIGEIGDWVLQEACRQLARWRAQGFTVPRLSLNLSMPQLEREGLVQMVAEQLKRWKIPASQLELEVTESVIMRQTGRAMELLDGLRKQGIYLAIDDFGTGYSSLSYLRELPVHRLKIDYSFVRNIGGDENDEAIARAIISLGKSLKLEVVAEGVEREEQAAFLRQEGCDVAQGFFYAYPLSAEALEEEWQLISSRHGGRGQPLL